ncbi:MAG TPA: hypothetical protein DCX08_12435 [Porticoccaceae bacterium]|jgi:uncharacterized RDD family membrane protein YckC|nr:hypothetical protein [Porticoccaceae bacterium]
MYINLPLKITRFSTFANMTNSTDLPISCNEFTSAGLFRRMAALVYDLFLLAAIVMAYALVVITPLRMAFYGMPQENGDWLGFPIWLQIVIMFGLSFVLISYYWLCWRKQGQSMGMKAWRLKLIQNSGELATNQQCWLRAALAPLSLALFGIGYLWCLLPPNKECIHDRITGTKVVVVPKIAS